MERRGLWVFLVIVLGLGGVAVLAAADLHLPGNHQGYEPVQPIAFSHRLHAGELNLDCLYCHSAAPRSRHAGIPAAGICMNCHKLVTSSFDAVLEERQRAEVEGREPATIVSDELRKLYDAFGLGENLEPDPARTPAPIQWVRVHNLPDFVYFDHRTHVNRGVACETCHGPVQSMERIHQWSDLSMGWCVQCHRDNPAAPDEAKDLVDPGHAEPPGVPADHVSTDCVGCHI